MLAMHENEVIRLLSSGQHTQAVYDWFYQNFYPPTVGLARRFGIPVSDAVTILTEITADTMLKIGSGAGSAIVQLRGYVYGALRNRMYTYLRTRDRQRIEAFDAAFRELAEMPSEEPDDAKEAMIARLYRCLEKLPPGLRDPLRLRYLDECEYEEISSRLNITLRSAVVFVSRGMIKLRDCMSNT